MGIKQAIEKYINVLAENKKKCVHDWELMSKKDIVINDKDVGIRVWTYRCKKCGWRNWKFNYLLTRRILYKILLYIILMILASFIVYNVLKMVV